MAQLTLRTFTCTIDLLSSERLKWPLQSHLEHLTVDRCTRKEFCIILHRLPHLQTFVVHTFNLEVYNEYECLSMPYPQLTSLTMKQSFWSMDKLESLLSLTSSIVQLRLKGSADDATFDGFRWERVIRTKLLSLERFEFCFRSQSYHVIELIAVQFRTPFWLNEKRWSINCVYDNAMEEVILCSNPNFITELEYNFIGPLVVSTINQTTTINHVSKYRSNTTDSSEVCMRLLVSETMNNTISLCLFFRTNNLINSFFAE